MKSGFVFRLLLLTVLFLVLTGCARHITNEQMSTVLNQRTLYETFSVIPADLSVKSKCKGQPSVKIVNAENRTEDYLAFDDRFRTRYVNPREMMDHVALYLKSGFEKSRIRVADDSSKVLHLKLVELQGTSDWRFKSFFKMEVSIPEKQFSKVYDAWEYTGGDNTNTFFKTSAYAIHAVTRKVIDDPMIQDYILCR